MMEDKWLQEKFVVVLVVSLIISLFCKWEILEYVSLLMEDLEFQADRLRFNFRSVASFKPKNDIMKSVF